MTSVRPILSGVAVAMALACGMAAAVEEIPAHQRKRINEAVPSKARVVAKSSRRVLIFNTPDHLYVNDPHKGYCIPYGSYAFQALGRKTGAFEPVVSGDLAMFLPENLKRFDAVVLNNTSGAWITPADSDMQREPFRAHGADKEAVEGILRKSLLDYVAGGGGIVACHFAIGGNRHWPEFHAMLGATFTGHPWNEEVGVRVEEPDHPLVSAFEGKDFRLADEIYQFGEPYSREQVRVLLSIDTATTNMGVKWISREDNDFALAWVKAHGAGRVFCTSFGHRTELFWNPVVLQSYLDAIQFATGDLAAPTEPRVETRLPVLWPGPTPPDARRAKLAAKGVREPSADELKEIEAAAPREAARPAKRRRVLVWGHAWTHTPNVFAAETIRILGEKSGAFAAVVSDDPRLLLGDRLPQFDALVMNNIHEPDPFLPEDFKTRSPSGQEAARKFDQAVKESIMEYVKGGKGIVGTHAATAALQSWPEYGEMMGGYYGGHILQDVVIKVELPEHPVNACFHGEPWTINDEIYIFREPYARRDVEVLLSLDLERMADPGKRADKDYAVSWVRRWGEGRVFYTTVGHNERTHMDPLFLRHLLAGVQFAIGDLR